jgi:hypothetical protein
MLKNKFLSIFMLFKLLKNNKIDERKQNKKKDRRLLFNKTNY